MLLQHPKKLTLLETLTLSSKKKKSKPNYNSTAYTDEVSEQDGLCSSEKAKERQTISLALSLAKSLLY